MTRVRWCLLIAQRRSCKFSEPTKCWKHAPADLERIRAGRRAGDSPEFRAKQRAAKLGKRFDAEAKARMKAAQRKRRDAERAAGGAGFSEQALANMRDGQQRRRDREKALGIPRAPRPSDEQIARLIAGRRRRAAEQNAAKQR